jgi:ubiquitin-protein ligase
MGGLWQFDVALPPSYPDVPPNVKFMTTGGGTVRVNPK